MYLVICLFALISLVLGIERSKWRVVTRVMCAILSVALFASYFFYVYPWWPYDGKVVSIRDGRLVPHPWGAIASPQVYWLDLGGKLSYGMFPIAIGAMDQNIIGVAKLNIDLEFDPLVFIPRSGYPAYNDNSCWLKRWVESQNLKHWDLLKAWVKAGMPDSEIERNTLVEKYLGSLKDYGATPVVKFSWEPGIDLFPKQITRSGE